MGDISTFSLWTQTSLKHSSSYGAASSIHCQLNNDYGDLLDIFEETVHLFHKIIEKFIRVPKNRIWECGVACMCDDRSSNPQHPHKRQIGWWLA
jgi:hypothetical protein